MAHNLGIKLYKFLLQVHGFLIAQNKIAVVVVALLHGQRYNETTTVITCIFQDAYIYHLRTCQRPARQCYVITSFGL